MTTMLTSNQAALRIGYTVDTLKRWRRKKKGPPYVRLDGTDQGRVRYPEDKLEQWLEERTVSA